jgi:DNA-binding MarR family transcriptional regulator
MAATTEKTSTSAPAPGDGELTLADALVQFAHLIDHLYADVSRDHGCTPQQIQLLCELMRGPVGMTELTGLLHVERSSLTGLVDRVERRGLVKRVQNPSDRRAFRIALTPTGTRLAMACYHDVTAKVTALTNDVAPPNAKRLAAIVSGILADQRVPSDAR